MEDNKTIETTEVTPKYELGTKFKKGKQVGSLVHNDITKTLKFDDGSEVTLSPAEFKKWKMVDEQTTEEPKVEPVVEAKVEEPEVKEEVKADAPKEKKQRKPRTKRTTTKSIVTDKPQGNITWKEFEEYMCKHNSDKPPVAGVIVVSNDNFTEEYSLESRSYRVYSDAKHFNGGATISNALYGDAIDGSDPGVRLDYYNWKVEYCYVE